ncbi:hypothetical protein PV326_005085 [Microctonus aethiopoides]|nr:hypothetical protein PV326_005085 [Microctonus aethiopoides]
MEWAMVVDRALRRVRVILIAKSWEEASLEIDRAQYPRSYELSARLSRKDEKQKIKEKDMADIDGSGMLGYGEIVWLANSPLSPIIITRGEMPRHTGLGDRTRPLSNQMASNIVAGDFTETERDKDIGKRMRGKRK